MSEHIQLDRQIVSLADVSESVRYGYTASASMDEIGPKFLRITDIVPQCISWDSVPYCEGNESTLDKYLLQIGDIVVARTGATVGYAKQIRTPENAVFASYLVRFRINCEIAEPRFIGHLVESDVYKQYVKSQVGGAAQPNANAKVLGRFSFTLPPRRVQRRIADILSAYDDLIENNRRRIALLEQAAQELYREWFVRLRFPGHDSTRIVDGLPEGWKKANLGDIVPISKGKNITKGLVRDGHVPVVAGGLSPAYYHDTPNVLGPVVTISASGANAGYVNIYHEDIWASDCSFVSASQTERLFYFYLLLRDRQREILGLQRGAAQPHVYPKDLTRLIVPIPRGDIVDEFLELVSANFRQMGARNRHTARLVQARDLLLPRLMSRKVAV